MNGRELPERLKSLNDILKEMGEKSVPLNISDGIDWSKYKKEKMLNKLIPCSDEEARAIENIRDRIWQLYRELKADKETCLRADTHRQMPDEKTKFTLEKCFDEIFATRTGCEILDAALRRIAKNKTELLLILDRPDIPLHNNLSESDIREYAKKRKISGSTRSDKMVDVAVIHSPA